MNSTDANIIQCGSCGAKNRVPVEQNRTKAKCGRCHVPLNSVRHGTDSKEAYLIRCPSCKAKNKVPGSKLDDVPKCGKCSTPLPVNELFMPQPMMVTDDNFDATVVQSPLPVLLFCWAPWCPTCGNVAPIIEEFASTAKGKIRVGKVNVDANPGIASRYNILSVPYLFIWDNGQLRESFPGGLQKYDLMMKMAPYL